MLQKLQPIHRGKAKTLYTTADPAWLIMEFRDDISAFNAEKLANLPGKGQINNAINAYVMGLLKQAGIPCHFEKLISPTESLVRTLKMFPIECVVRNFAAGSLSKKLGITWGTPLSPPTYELFFKNDALGDPMINESHVRTFGWASDAEMEQIKALTLKVNKILLTVFSDAGLDLADYKLEFGKAENTIFLADEFSPDGCRIWDSATKNILDKDRFRKDLGGVVEAYQEVGKRLGVALLP